MLTPAQRHRQAALAAQSAPSVVSSTNAVLLMQLVEDKRTLSGIQSIAAKIDKKRELLTNYAGFLDGLTGKTTGLAGDDAVLLSELYVWLVDCFDLARVNDLFVYMQSVSIDTPDKHARDLATFTAEETAVQINLRLKSGHEFSAVEIEHLLTLESGLLNCDMPDAVTADLSKAMGYVFAAKENYNESINRLQRADTLDDKAGVKNELKRLAKLQKLQDDSNPERTPQLDGSVASTAAE